MGEDRAARERIGCSQSADVVFQLDNHPQIAVGIAELNSFFGDNLICVHSDASGYINVKLDPDLEEALMFKSKGINGELANAS
jgi:hypothetical protein